MKENIGVSDSTKPENAHKETLVKKLLCFTLTVGIVLADQFSKAIVVMLVPIRKQVQVLGDFIILEHVRNPDFAFSFGRDLPPFVKQLLFYWVPILVIGFIVYLMLGSKETTKGQRWILAAICGGGIGNLIDRIIRPEGVVDFVSVKLYGLFGFERWPTFNVADSTIVVCAILLFVSIIVTEIKIRKQGVKHSTHE
jgi:signal peptidase II